MQTGTIIDFYDDPTGVVLKERLAEDQIPDFIKTAEHLGDKNPPDDVFALVMVDRERKLRKFACVDKGNTALSVIYFMENRNKLPEEAQKVAAANLIEACKVHELAVPWGLRKVAGKAPDHNYVDITGQEAPVQMEKVASQRHCLPGKFPIDSYGQVQQAVDWFEKHAFSLHPEHRREYCVNLSARAEELGIPTTKDIKKYAGSGYAPDGELQVAVATRKQMWRDGTSEQSLLDGLMEKKAEVPPEVFCEALRQFDEATGLDHYWDDAIYDPWYSTYGMEKTAEWKFESHGDRITERQLRGLTAGSFQLFKEKFGEEMAEEFRKNPIQIFDSLPLDSKRIIMRLANDPQPSPHLTLA